MPWAPKKPCAHPSCNRLSHGRYCPKHKRVRDTRPSASKRGYDRQWRKLRDQFIKLNPICVECGEKAEIADHIIPRRSGGPDTWENLQPLCWTCHNRKTAKGL